MKIILLVSLFVVYINAETTTPRHMPGGKHDIDPNSAAVTEAANFAYILISDSINSVFAHKLGKVTKAQSQVVAGVKYFLTIEVNETNCKKDAKDLTACDVTKTEVCDAVVLSRPWDEIHKKQLLEYSCKPSSTY